MPLTEYATRSGWTLDEIHDLQGYIDAATTQRQNIEYLRTRTVRDKDEIGRELLAEIEFPSISEYNARLHEIVRRERLVLRAHLTTDGDHA